MFKITVMCQDKKLPELLWDLVGRVVGPPEVIPIRGAEVVSGEVREAIDVGPKAHGGNPLGRPKEPGTQLPARVAARLAKAGIAEVTHGQLVRAIEAEGSSSNALSYTIKWLRANGLFAPSAGRGQYELTKKALRQNEETVPERGKPLTQKHARKRQLAESMPGKALQKLLDEGLTEVSKDHIAKAFMEVGGSRSSYYYAIVRLQDLGILGRPASAQGTYTVNTTEAHRQLTQGV